MSRSKNTALLLVGLADILATICIASICYNNVWAALMSGMAAFIIGCIILSKPRWAELRAADKAMADAIYGIFIAEFGMAVIAALITLYLILEMVISRLTRDKDNTPGKDTQPHGGPAAAAW